MPQFSELQTRVRTRLIDLPSAVADEVPALLNKAMRELQRRHNFKVMEADSGLLLTSVGERTLTMPSDFKELRARPQRVENTGYVRDLIVAPDRNALQRRWETDDEGYPQALLDAEPDADGTRNFEVWPLPDGNSDYDDGEYRIQVPYWRFLPDLSADNDTNWFTEHADWYLVAKATAEGFWVDWDEERATVWEQKAQNEFSQILLADKYAQVMGIDTLVPYLNAHEAQLRG